MTKTITSTELKNKSGEVIQDLTQGNIIIITHYGKEIGRIIPNDKKEAIKNIKNIMKDVEPLNTTLEKIKEERLSKHE